MFNQRPWALPPFSKQAGCGLPLNECLYALCFACACTNIDCMNWSVRCILLVIMILFVFDDVLQMVKLLQ